MDSLSEAYARRINHSLFPCSSFIGIDSQSLAVFVARHRTLATTHLHQDPGVDDCTPSPTYEHPKQGLSLWILTSYRPWSDHVYFRRIVAGKCLWSLSIVYLLQPDVGVGRPPLQNLLTQSALLQSLWPDITPNIQVSSSVFD